MPEKAVLPQIHLICYAPKAQDTWSVLPEMVAFKDPLTLDIGYLSCLGSSFVIEIQTHARKIGLERICWNKKKIRQVYCHTKAMTTLVEYWTSCLYENSDSYSVLIVWSASWLKLKSSHLRIFCEENFYLCVRLMQNLVEYFQQQQNSLYDV